MDTFFIASPRWHSMQHGKKQSLFISYSCISGQKLYVCVLTIMVKILTVEQTCNPVFTDLKSDLICWVYGSSR